MPYRHNWQQVIDAVEAELQYCLTHFEGPSAQEHVDGILEGIGRDLGLFVRLDDEKRIAAQLAYEAANAIVHGSPDCELTESESYQCLQCGRACCDCFGQDDMYFDYCDDCVDKGIKTDYRPGDEDVAGVNTKFRMECV